MNNLILCEGVTDAILLSYYLEKTSGWKYSKGPKNLEIKQKSQNEAVNWYKKDEDYLLICSVGGKDNFGKFFESRIKSPIINADAFCKIVIITDHDTRTINEITDEIKGYTGGFIYDVADRKWSENKYFDSFGIEKVLSMLLIIIPQKYHGALETVMLDAISEVPYDKNIVDKIDIFISQLRKDADKYILTDRLQLKAKLGVTWAIQFPEKVFSRIDEQIKNVEWEKYELLNDCFFMLIEL